MEMPWTESEQDPARAQTTSYGCVDISPGLILGLALVRSLQPSLVNPIPYHNSAQRSTGPFSLRETGVAFLPDSLERGRGFLAPSAVVTGHEGCLCPCPDPFFSYASVFFSSSTLLLFFVFIIFLYLVSNFLLAKIWPTIIVDGNSGNRLRFHTTLSTSDFSFLGPIGSAPPPTPPLCASPRTSESRSIPCASSFRKTALSGAKCLKPRLTARRRCARPSRWTTKLCELRLPAAL
ncbi:hypothetical protein V8C35DRAFT_36557 [Trichoderma chlorosporum]